MKIKKTVRGFSIIEFKDDNGESCSLQKSSAAFEDKIWLGIDKAKITEFFPMPRKDTEEPWVDLDKQYIEEKLKHRPQNEIHFENQRMHLTQKQVKKLLPHLIAFAETGEIEVNNEL